MSTVMSHPTCVRGLKPIFLVSYRNDIVAPYVGAWIETERLCARTHAKTVAPYVGAWIETVVTKSVPA